MGQLHPIQQTHLDQACLKRGPLWRNNGAKALKASSIHPASAAGDGRDLLRHGPRHNVAALSGHGYMFQSDVLQWYCRRTPPGWMLWCPGYLTGHVAAFLPFPKTNLAVLGTRHFAIRRIRCVCLSLGPFAGADLAGSRWRWSWQCYLSCCLLPWLPPHRR